MNYLVTIILLLMLTSCGLAPTMMVVENDLRIELVTDPAPPLASHDTTITLTLNAHGSPLSAASVMISRAMPGMEHDSDQERLVAEELGPGRYRATTSFSMGGRWNVVLLITDHDGSLRTVTIPVEVEQP